MIKFALVVLVAMAASAQTRLNQIQVIGSHNSYHAGLPPSAAKWLEQLNPKSFAGLDYQHPALDAQFDAGVRQVEIDVFADTQGGRFAHPANLKMIADAGLPADAPFDPQGLFLKPGFKVMHVQDIDYRSNCQPFTGCLQTILKWSKAHPGHLPIFVLIETKEGAGRPFQQQTEHFTPAVFDDLDKEIRSVFDGSRMIVPDDVRGSHATLNEAVLAGAWPTLDAARGKVIFLLDQRKAEAEYVEGHPSLKGRVIFTNAEPGAADAAFTEVNDPLKDPALIPGLVKQGYLVRSRTDADTVQARTGDSKMRDAAMASGAQILSSDYYFNEKSRWTDYSVSFPGGKIARCNPVTSSTECSLR